MRISFFAYSRQGCGTADRIMKLFPGHTCRSYTLEKYLPDGWEIIKKSDPSFYEWVFYHSDAMVFIGSCGIAVRQIAPFIRNKRTDPGVVVVDELGGYVIPLLSGHIGGANALAKKVAEGIGAIPVITTATDINQKFSVDSWAVQHAFEISDMKAAKAVSAEILERDVPLHSDFPVVTALPSGVNYGEDGDVGILISWEMKEPFSTTLRLVPKVLHLGIGCRRDTPVQKIRDAVESVLKTHQIDAAAIKEIASIDLKAEEQGLLAFCRENCFPITFYSAEQLQNVEGTFSRSAFVSSVTGVDNVCERSAMIGADKLIVKKTVCDGVTVAVAAESLEVHFG